MKVMLGFKLATPASSVRCATDWAVEPGTNAIRMEYF